MRQLMQVRFLLGPPKRMKFPEMESGGFLIPDVMRHYGSEFQTQEFADRHAGERIVEARIVPKAVKLKIWN